MLHANSGIRIRLVSASIIIDVPDDYETIQEAVYNANDGDIIKVVADTYREHVFINKSITLEGADPTTTIIDGTGNGTILRLEASGINITGFTICNAGSTHNAIALERDKATNDDLVIFNNIITTSQYGVYLFNSKRNDIRNNTLFDNFISDIQLNSADNNDIIGNTLSGSTFGIKLMYSSDTTISGNTISASSYGIYLSDSSTGNTMSQNTVSGQTAGIYSGSDGNIIHHNTATECAYGIYFYKCKNGEIYYNTLANNSYGIRVWWHAATITSHQIHNNKAIYNDWGIELTKSLDNTFTGNWIQQNTHGVYLAESASNTFYHNNFVQNTVQAYEGGLNTWDNGAEGNYWSDYEERYPDATEIDDSGIWNTSYAIIPGYDNYPLMDTWSEHDVSIENVTLSTSQTHAGPIVNITVTVKNNGKISPPTSETFSVTAKYGSNAIDTEPVVDLAQGANTTLTFHWNTTGVVSGSHPISAEATIVTDELNTDNNNFLDGSIYIIFLGDINADGAVNGEDLVFLTEAYGSTEGAPNWNPDTDLNEDNTVDVLDLLILSEDYGKTA